MELYKGNCLDILPNIDTKNKILVIDPPFNISYHYNKYKDNMKKEAYLELIKTVISFFDRFVIIHYPESLVEISIEIGKVPDRIVQWVYNSNTRRQHRSIGFYGFMPDFSKVKQPYKNPTDKRVKKLIEKGSDGTNIYDWWNVNQVKNVSKEKTKHPCQMPIEVMSNIIGILPDNSGVVDCFMGSGSTGVACNMRGNRFIGIEIDETYFDIARERIEKSLPEPPKGETTEVKKEDFLMIADLALKQLAIYKTETTGEQDMEQED